MGDGRQTGREADKKGDDKTGGKKEGGEGTNPNAPPGTILEALGDRLVVATGSDAVRVLNVQIAGKKTMPASDFLRGHRIFSGDHFGG